MAQGQEEAFYVVVIASKEKQQIWAIAYFMFILADIAVPVVSI